MRSTWKGLIIGALTGAAIGLVDELLSSMGRAGRRGATRARAGAADAAASVQQHAHEAAASAHTHASDATSRLKAHTSS